MAIHFSLIVPGGKSRRGIAIDRPSDVEAKATAIRRAGYVFEAELLSSRGAVSLSVSDGTASISERLSADSVGAIQWSVDDLIVATHDTLGL